MIVDVVFSFLGNLKHGADMARRTGAKFTECRAFEACFYAGTAASATAFLAPA